MILDPYRIPKREKLILVGLFLSKFDEFALTMLGFESFTEAFNVIGFALGGKPASIKNYRDEFDPLFPNLRAGWHQRSLRPHCVTILSEYGSLDIQTFCALVKSLVGYDGQPPPEATGSADADDKVFAQRLITGRAAEHYFESIQPTLPQFSGYTVENTTLLGCGYDFCLRSKADDEYLAVEVKGLNDKGGGLSFTPKEHRVAATLTDRFYLFVVKNFRESPFHEIYQNPLKGPLAFQRKERVIVQISWVANV